VGEGLLHIIVQGVCSWAMQPQAQIGYVWQTLHHLGSGNAHKECLACDFNIHTGPDLPSSCPTVVIVESTHASHINNFASM